MARDVQVIETRSQAEMQVLREYRQVPDSFYYNLQRLNEDSLSGDQEDYVNSKDFGGRWRVLMCTRVPI